MPKNRASQINLNSTPFYHCISRCVRRGFLCGIDRYTGKSYEHRRQWVENRIIELTKIFTIELCAFAVMSNHTHIVLRVNAKKAQNLSKEQVLERYHRLHRGTLLTQIYMDKEKRHTLSESEIEVIEASVQSYRERLYDLSWFMRELNEYIARKANKEDECTGRFWEGRFKSQALLTESAVLSCMAYVDLNPIRAGISKTLETSQHTSIFLRKHSGSLRQPDCLVPFKTRIKPTSQYQFDVSLSDYIDVLNETKNALLKDKISLISRTSTIIHSIGLKTKPWLILTSKFENQFSGAVGDATAIRSFCQLNHIKRPHQIKNATLLFGT